MPESGPPKAQPYKAHPWPLSDSTASPELVGWCGTIGRLCAGVPHQRCGLISRQHRSWMEQPLMQPLTARLQPLTAGLQPLRDGQQLLIKATVLPSWTSVPYSINLCRTADSPPCGTSPAWQAEQATEQDMYFPQQPHCHAVLHSKQLCHARGSTVAEAGATHAVRRPSTAQSPI